MASRLDRLFVLLDTGSSTVTRKAAALQLGEVQKLHPHELHNLLAKLQVFLKSSQWDTRIAAGQAVRAIISNVPQWDPAGSGDKKDPWEASDQLSFSGRMKFDKFDVNKVLRNGACLLGSEGKEYEVEEESGIQNKECLANQRRALNKRLGLDVAESVGLDTCDIFSNDDLMVSVEKPQLQVPEIDKKVIAQVVQEEMAQLGPGLSSREKNRAKRKAKIVAKQRSRDATDASTSISTSSNGNELEEPDLKKRRTSFLVAEDCLEDTTFSVDSSLDSVGLCEESGEWPFEGFCDQLSQDLFSPMWEIRHGAATALREIVQVHGRGAGKIADSPSTEMEYRNQLWLEDMVLRLLCVLALDRFGDFISDQVVAPVRETCAQALAAVLVLMKKDSVQGVTKILLQLLQQNEWEARHGGLLGMKYLLTVRSDMTSDLLPVVFVPIFQGLQDDVDDVCAVAASALVPVADVVVKDLPEEVPHLISKLWDSLLEQDDLTTSTNSLMTLLASFLSHPLSTTKYSPSQPLNELVPRLWPFLGHTSSSVRKATLQTLYTLTSSNNQQSTWLDPILPEFLRHIFQRSILEHVNGLLDLVHEVWNEVLTKAPLDCLLRSSCPYLSSWLCLIMQPSRIAITSEMLLEAKHKPKEKHGGKCRHSSLSDGKDSQEKKYIGGCESLNETSVERERIVMRARFLGARLLGSLSCYITKPMPGVIYVLGMETPIESYANLLLFYLNAKSALQRLAIALVLRKWAENDQACQCSDTVKTRLLECLSENIYYDEITLAFTRMQHECRDFIALLRHHKLDVDAVANFDTVITVEQAGALCSTTFEQLVLERSLNTKVQETLDARRKSVLLTVSQTSQDQASLNTAVQAAIAGAVVAVQRLPDKLNPVIKPLMDSLKKEEDELLQNLSAKSITRLLEMCVTRAVCPNTKIIKNICNILTADPYFTPRIIHHPQNSDSVPESSYKSSAASNPIYNGIMTLSNLRKHGEKNWSLRRCNSTSSRSKSTSGAEAEILEMDEIEVDEETQRQNELQRRGAQFAVAEMARHTGAEFPEKLPQLWEAMMGLLSDIKVESFDATEFHDNDVAAQDLVNSLQVFEATVPHLHKSLYPKVSIKLYHLCVFLEHPYTAVRHMAARCLGTLSKSMTLDTMTVIVDRVLPLLGASENDTARQGGAECLSNIVDCLGFNIVPYIVLLVVPVLGCMSDVNQAVRLMATHCFATLIRLMPLEGGVRDPPDFGVALAAKKQQDRKFLQQLFDVKSIEPYTVPVPINAELRAYQQDGVNWLSFLNAYKLHGILCDDMGLGKTLQSICILAGDHYNRDQEYKKSKVADCAFLPSIVVCPPTLTGHWVYEVEKFVRNKYLNPLHYTGPPAERQRLRSKVKKHNLIIASYDIVRNDIDFFSAIRWNYCILDEGHMIKNGKTKLSKAIKQLLANHRLILTGTPIQNNVLELWSLFDFLMPGFMGTEKQFIAHYSKPILLSRDAKSSSAEQEAGAIAMESLHRQVLPFVLRRMKEDVLQDLPPKIIQDYYCDLSPLQAQLYEDFSKSRARQTLEECLEDSQSSRGQTHVFQALQYLRKVCNHPKLALNASHPEFQRIIQQLQEQKSLLSDIHHGAKLPALKQLLLDCGIGVDCGSSGPAESVVNQHRALIFCQVKAMLDILEQDLFRVHFPNVSYLRLDGSVPAGARHSVVHRFNTDPSLDVLLLTTQVGGLGLNLTGADTVIFVEHDWNPMKDLQAMDRAHRIGQKKVVNVYRLITKGTLEEKIMGLQKFKLSIANTVISSENSSLASMGTDQLLELFSVDSNRQSSSESSSSKSVVAGASKVKGVHTILDSLPDLWDEQQYETEYNLDSFLKSLKK